MNSTLKRMHLLAWLIAGSAFAQMTPDKDVAIGRSIYLTGALPDGSPIKALRSNSETVTGQAAACVNCHRGSGLGQVEGNVGIPPITGRALFREGEPVHVRMDNSVTRTMSALHAPYDSASFKAAVRDGVLVSGAAMHPLMPRYMLANEHVTALEAYLKTLSVTMSPGVDADTIRMATVIAPGVSPERRKAVIDTLTTAVKQMNLNVRWGKRQKLIDVQERRHHSRRKWSLDIWELNGPSTTWAEQLAQRQREKPVFAILSGLALDNWQPVQDFCESSRVACWFPSLDLVPENAAQGNFSLYFSAGVALEAQVMARSLQTSTGRVVQITAPNAVAQGGAQALRKALSAGRTTGVADVSITDGAGALKAALSGLTERDTVVLWLREADFAALSELPATPAQVLISATTGGSEQLVLPPALRRNARLVQPLEVPRLRTANVERLDAWLTGSQVPRVDLRLQSEAYFAAVSLQATVRGMLNNLHTDYLIERAEATLTGYEAMQVQEEIQAMMMGPMNKRPQSHTQATPAEKATMEATTKAQLAHLEEMRVRGGTTVYPRLNLAQGQRFASKGAYLMRLNPDAPGVTGEPEWLVP